MGQGLACRWLTGGQQQAATAAAWALARMCTYRYLALGRACRAKCGASHHPMLAVGQGHNKAMQEEGSVMWEGRVHHCWCCCSIRKTPCPPVDRDLDRRHTVTRQSQIILCCCERLKSAAVVGRTWTLKNILLSVGLEALQSALRSPTYCEANILCSRSYCGVIRVR